MRSILYVLLIIISSSIFADDCKTSSQLAKGDPQQSAKVDSSKTEASGFLRDDICETKAMDTLDSLLGKTRPTDSGQSTQ